MTTGNETRIHGQAEHEPQEIEHDEVHSLSLFQSWWKNSAWPGMGLLGESYLLFSIGLIKPFWQNLYPACFSYESCSKQLLSSLTFSVVIGVIIGMISVGYIANSIGRRMGGITTASLMCFGSTGLTLVSFIFSNNPQLLFRCSSALLFIFGIGVGGEYPISSSTATERAMEETKKRLNQEVSLKTPISPVAPSVNGDMYVRHFDVVSSHDQNEPNLRQNESRGREVQLVFLSQGIGILVNSCFLVILLLIFRQYGREAGEGNYDRSALLSIWRIVYSVGTALLVIVLATRLAYLQESQTWSEDKDRRLKDEAFRNAVVIAKPSSPSHSLVFMDASSTSTTLQFDKNDNTSFNPVSLLLHNFGWRMFGSSMAWFLWDISFYGNKLFQSSFLIALTGKDTSLLQLCCIAAVNAFVALLGYIGAALLIDLPQFGRLKLQVYGFLITGVLFIVCGLLFHRIMPLWLIVMYLASSFVGQLGPNATTFLIPSEIFPTQMRTFCHGIAAASGKLGALFAAIIFNYCSEVDLFLICGYASCAGFLVTVFTIPDVTNLDLHEIDKLWLMILDGRREDYTGDAINPRNLSYYERTTMLKK